MASVTDYYLVYRFIKALVTPFKKTKAYKLGIIDEKGKILKKLKELETPEEKSAYGRFERMIWNLKKVLQKVPIINKNFVSIAAASLLLFKEDDNRYETTYAKYLIEDIKFLNESINIATLNNIEKYADRLFSAVGIDVEFTKHFYQRVNDKRNKEEITHSELIRLFKQTYKKYGKMISKLDVEAQAVITDMMTDINMPFVLVWDDENQEIDLVAKTIMRKRGFQTTNRRLTIEDMPVTNSSSGNFAGLPPDDPPVSKSTQKKIKKRNKKKRKKFSEYQIRGIISHAENNKKTEY